MIAEKFNQQMRPAQPLSLNSAPVERSYPGVSQAPELPTSRGPETTQPATIRKKGGWPKGKPRGNR